MRTHEDDYAADGVYERHVGFRQDYEKGAAAPDSSRDMRAIN